MLLRYVPYLFCILELTSPVDKEQSGKAAIEITKECIAHVGTMIEEDL
jgi:hypothetical protein